MKILGTIIPVVAVALVGRDGRVLMQRRRESRAHGGLWEFPGGKLEAGETPVGAAAREIFEELGLMIAPSALEAVGFAADTAPPAGGRAAHVIMLYLCREWAAGGAAQGAPQCLDAAEIGWFAPPEIAGLAMPPLDYPLAEGLLRFLGGKVK